MSEADVVAKTPTPRTRATLLHDLGALGVREGTTLLVHSSLSAIGWVAGGEVTLIQALLDAVGPEGTLVMPAHSAHLTDPALWKAPPVSAEWIDTIRATMPAFDPARTSTRKMGVAAELFRTWPGAKRSLHPSASFAAIGPYADQILDDHRLESPLGEYSPLARLYDLDADILLLGVGYDRCTAFHLAEGRAFPHGPLETNGAPMLVDGARRWVTYVTQQYDSEYFPKIGELLVRDGVPKVGHVGSATSHLLRLRYAVDVATEWFRVSSAS